MRYTYREISPEGKGSITAYNFEYEDTDDDKPVRRNIRFNYAEHVFQFGNLLKRLGYVNVDKL